MYKNDLIINYIKSLEVGTRISVRSIASALNVSEGTAYRAIKDSDKLGYVTTIPRVGTVRIEKVEKKNIETLTYAEVVNIVGGSILGGRGGIHKTLDKFLIGAMTLDAIKNYLTENCLFIVGNREEAQKLALEHNSGVLVTGGFNCSEEIKNLANKMSLPLISSSYDTFTIASMINKALSESLIKKEILLVEDIMKKPYYLYAADTVYKWKELIKDINQERFPVVDNDFRVIGIVTLKDGIGALPSTPVSKIMSKDTITLTPKTTLAYASHIMGMEGIEICPVVEGKKLKGVISRQDVIKALQYKVKQPMTGESFGEQILRNFEADDSNGSVIYKGKITTQMLDDLGTASWSTLNMLMSSAGIMSIKKKMNTNTFVDSISTYFLRPVQLDSFIALKTDIFDMGRNFCKVQVDMTDRKGDLVAKSILSIKILRK
ncbi:MAG: CBS domain-containing protein [Bacillota bacterium]|nr:CBS domain-containing protein [Bacillota bacterium]